MVGSVRSNDKGSHLAKLFNTSKFAYEVVPDIAAPSAFDDALEKHPEVTIFLHTASPFTYQIEDIEKDLLTPAISGTKNALSAIQKHGSNVKHVVITSSYAAIGTTATERDTSLTRTEETWNEITWDQALEKPFLGYRGSKTFAERAAWEFVKEHKPQYTLSTVNPTFVFGPQLFDSEVKESMNTSLEYINKMIRGGPSQEIGSESYGYVDVRDVAEAHIIAFENPKAHLKRLLLSCDRVVPQDIFDILNEEFPELKGKIPVGEPGSGRDLVKQYAKIDGSQTIKIIGHDLTPLRKIVVDSVKQILAKLGHQ